MSGAAEWEMEYPVSAGLWCYSKEGRRKKKEKEKNKKSCFSLNPFFFADHLWQLQQRRHV
jgi:hypothetical protein